MKKIPNQDKRKPSKTDDDAAQPKLLVPMFDILVQTSGILSECIEKGSFTTHAFYSVLIALVFL